MNPRPEKSLFEEAALLKGMAVSFLEKDWFVTQVIATLAALNHQGFEIIFSGGTALSKGHGLLQRFSEDVDLCVRAPQAVSRKTLSGFKHAVVAALRQQGFALSDNQIKAGTAIGLWRWSWITKAFLHSPPPCVRICKLSDGK